MDEHAEKPNRWLKVIVVNFLFLVACCFVVVGVFLFIYQEKLIYYPRRYLGDAPDKSWHELHSTTADGRQTSFYARAGNQPIDPSFRPSQLWVVFSGNAAVAAEWESFVKSYPDANTAFLVIDYPGYGFSQGRPSPDSIFAGADGAYHELEKLIGADALRQVPTGLLGHSLGAAAGLDFFVREHLAPNKVVLVAPFTTLRVMARRAVGWPLCLLLRHDFDNVARMKELLAMSPKPSVTIFHGTADEVIPFEIGKRLAAEYPEIVFHEVSGEMHNTIIDRAHAAIQQAMLS